MGLVRSGTTRPATKTWLPVCKRSLSNTNGGVNTATGSYALQSNTDGTSNTAIGLDALRDNTTGNDNTAIGSYAGASITGSGNVCIGVNAYGERRGEQYDLWDREMFHVVLSASGRAVYVDFDGKVGTLGFLPSATKKRSSR